MKITDFVEAARDFKALRVFLGLKGKGTEHRKLNLDGMAVDFFAVASIKRISWTFRVVGNNSLVGARFWMALEYKQSGVPKRFFLNTQSVSTIEGMVPFYKGLFQTQTASNYAKGYVYNSTNYPYLALNSVACPAGTEYSKITMLTFCSNYQYNAPVFTSKAMNNLLGGLTGTAPASLAAFMTDAAERVVKLKESLQPVAATPQQDSEPPLFELSSAHVLDATVEYTPSSSGTDLGTKMIPTYTAEVKGLVL